MYKKEKVFFGSVKEMTNDYWTMYSLWIKKEDIQKLKFNDKGYANVSIKKSKSWNRYWEVYEGKWYTQSIVDEEDELPF